MKEKELRDCSTCGLCNKKIGASGLPSFFRIKVERHFLDIGALQRQTGLAMSMGDAGPLAMYMGPNEEMTKVIGSREITVCETCAMKTDNMLVYHILEHDESEGVEATP